MTENNEFIHALALIVSGAALFAPYMLISKIAENIDKFGSDNYGKRIISMKVLSAQSGGVVLFYGCYIITIGFIATFLNLIPRDKPWFLLFIFVGVPISWYGLKSIYLSLKEDKSWTCALLPGNHEANDKKTAGQNNVLTQNFNCCPKKEE